MDLMIKYEDVHGIRNGKFLDTEDKQNRVSSEGKSSEQK